MMRYVRWTLTGCGAALALAHVGCGDSAGPADRQSIAEWMAFYEVPGVSVAVIRDFRIAYVEVYGVKNTSTRDPVTETTLFQAASLSKGTSAVGVLSLAQDGIVSLDAEVNRYLRSWQLPANAFQANEKVTLRRLLSHTAGTTVRGFRGYRYTEPLPTLVQILDGVPPANSPPIVVDREPGSAFRYSGGGYVVMEQTVRDVTGLSFPEFMRRRVLARVSMEHSTYEQPLPDSLRDAAASGYYASGAAVPGGHHIYPEIGAAGLWTTAADLARLLIEVQRSSRGESHSVLSRGNVAVLLTEVKSDYALGFAVWADGGDRYFGHEGANDGFRCAMRANLHRGDGAVVMTNSDNGLELAEAVFKLLGKREGWPGY